MAMMRSKTIDIEGGQVGGRLERMLTVRGLSKDSTTESCPSGLFESWKVQTIRHQGYSIIVQRRIELSIGVTPEDMVVRYDNYRLRSNNFIGFEVA